MININTKLIKGYLIAALVAAFGFSIAVYTDWFKVGVAITWIATFIPAVVRERLKTYA